MADYQRLISYMYRYENGVKKRNVGYARLETRNDLLKTTIHLQVPVVAESILPTYFILWHEDDMELVFLGDTVAKGQMMDAKIITKISDINNSGYPFSMMGGLIILEDGQIFYATEWSDIEIKWEQVLSALRLSAKRGTEELETTYTEETEDISLSVAETIEEADTVDTVDTADIAEEKVLAMELSEADVEKEDNTQELFESVEEKNEEQVHELFEREVQIDDEQMKEEQSFGERIESVSIEGFIYPNLFANCNKAEDGSFLPKSEEEPTDSSEIARDIFRNCPRIYPFEDQGVLDCAKLDLQDMNRFPAELRNKISNSFLLHGYYSYHHIIFIKLKEHEEIQYFLGVPGIFQNRERYMARMFGFEYFKGIKKKELSPGEFGYWFIRIEI